MGSASRRKPSRLAKKLLQIRKTLGLSQSGMLERLGEADELFISSISKFEHGEREPSLEVLLKYARVANVWLDVLVDDALDLPLKLPSPKKSEGWSTGKRLK